MNTQQYLAKLRSGEDMEFSDFICLIAKEYNFITISFKNGDLNNKADENQGSAKVFCFGLLHGLSEQETLRCFGEHYQSVLDSPAKDSSHLNIRNFILSGWQGVLIDASVLSRKASA